MCSIEKTSINVLDEGGTLCDVSNTNEDSCKKENLISLDTNPKEMELTSRHFEWKKKDWCDKEEGEVSDIEEGEIADFEFKKPSVENQQESRQSSHPSDRRQFEALLNGYKHLQASRRRPAQPINPSMNNMNNSSNGKPEKAARSFLSSFMESDHLKSRVYPSPSIDRSPLKKARKDLHRNYFMDQSEVVPLVRPTRSKFHDFSVSYEPRMMGYLYDTSPHPTHPTHPMMYANVVPPRVPYESFVVPMHYPNPASFQQASPSANHFLPGNHSYNPNFYRRNNHSRNSHFPPPMPMPKRKKSKKKKKILTTTTPIAAIATTTTSSSSSIDENPVEDMLLSDLSDVQKDVKTKFSISKKEHIGEDMILSDLSDIQREVHSNDGHLLMESRKAAAMLTTLKAAESNLNSKVKSNGIRSSGGMMNLSDVSSDEDAISAISVDDDVALVRSRELEDLVALRSAVLKSMNPKKRTSKSPKSPTDYVSCNSNNSGSSVQQETDSVLKTDSLDQIQVVKIMNEDSLSGKGLEDKNSIVNTTDPMKNSTDPMKNSAISSSLEDMVLISEVNALGNIQEIGKKELNMSNLKLVDQSDMVKNSLNNGLGVRNSFSMNSRSSGFKQLPPVAACTQSVILHVNYNSSSSLSNDAEVSKAKKRLEDAIALMKQQIAEKEKKALGLSLSSSSSSSKDLNGLPVLRSPSPEVVTVCTSTTTNVVVVAKEDVRNDMKPKENYSKENPTTKKNSLGKNTTTVNMDSHDKKMEKVLSQPSHDEGTNWKNVVEERQMTMDSVESKIKQEMSVLSEEEAYLLQLMDRQRKQKQQLKEYEASMLQLARDRDYAANQCDSISSRIRILEKEVLSARNSTLNTVVEL